MRPATKPDVVKHVLNPSESWYRNHLFDEILNVVSHSPLDKRNKIYVVGLVRHKLYESKFQALEILEKPIHIPCNVHSTKNLTEVDRENK
jgi:hypothetical protein